MLYRVRVDVYTEHSKEPRVRHVRWLMVEAANHDAAQAEACRVATDSTFGPKVVGIEWRNTSLVKLPFDLTEWADSREDSL